MRWSPRRLPLVPLALVAVAAGLWGCDEGARRQDALRPDVDPPARVRDLEVTAQEGFRVAVAWTAPGDDGSRGRAALYDLRWSTSRDSLLAWDGAGRTDLPPPAAAGVREAAVVTGLEIDSWYWFALRTADEAGNWSRVSEPVPGITACRFEVERTLGEGPLRVCAGDEVLTRWSGASCGDSTVTVELMQGTAVVATLAAAVPNRGWLRWTVPAAAGTTTVRVREVHEGRTASSPPYLVEAACAMEFTGFDPGPNPCVGQDLSVSWVQGSCCDESMRLERWQDGALVEIRFSQVGPTGGQWTVGPEQEGTWELVLRRNSDDVIVGRSEPVTVSSFAEPRVISPNGGEIYNGAAPLAITWDPGACHGETARITLLDEAGGADVYLAEVANDGQYAWQPPPGFVDLGAKRIEILDPAGGLSDVSDAPFTVACAIFVEQPGAAGVELCSHFDWDDPAASSVPIVWNSGTWCVEPVRIHLEAPGLPDLPLVSGWVEGSPFPWPWYLDQRRQPGTAYTVVVTGEVSGVTGVSPGTLVLDDRWGTPLQFPNHAAVFTAGELVLIRWGFAYCAGPTLDIELLRDGAVCAVIGSGVDARTGIASWYAAACDGVSDGYRIRLTDPGSGWSDQSTSAFRIVPAAPRE